MSNGINPDGTENPRARPPLGLPTGSVRALLALLIVAVVIVETIRGHAIDELWSETLLIALAHCFTSRRDAHSPLLGVSQSTRGEAGIELVHPILSACFAFDHHTLCLHVSSRPPVRMYNHTNIAAFIAALIESNAQYHFARGCAECIPSSGTL